MNVAIIPARAGSKRIPKKNVKPFAGEPIIAHSIQAAIASKIFDRVIVTTDSQEIAAVAKKYGAEAPFFRPPELSDDHTPTAPVIVHALEWLLENGVNPTYACCIYPTAPFVRAQYLRQGFEVMQEYGCATSYSVTSFAFPIFRGLMIKDDGCLEMFWPEFQMTRSQDLTEGYHDAGQFYWADCAKFLKEPKFYAKDSRPVILPRKFVQDIDTLEDWEMAESMYKALNLKFGE
jgi:pseudaminic acid cytidylyltransferase